MFTIELLGVNGGIETEMSGLYGKKEPEKRWEGRWMRVELLTADINNGNVAR